MPDQKSFEMFLINESPIDRYLMSLSPEKQSLLVREALAFYFGAVGLPSSKKQVFPSSATVEHNSFDSPASLETKPKSRVGRPPKNRRQEPVDARDRGNKTSSMPKDKETPMNGNDKDVFNPSATENHLPKEDELGGLLKDW